MERACLSLADLSGYTAYMANSEPEHAPALAGDLVDTVVRQLRPGFRLAKPRRRGLLAAPLERLDGPMLLDAVDATYDAFRRRLQRWPPHACTVRRVAACPSSTSSFRPRGERHRHRFAGREESQVPTR